MATATRRRLFDVDVGEDHNEEGAGGSGSGSGSDRGPVQARGSLATTSTNGGNGKGTADTAGNGTVPSAVKPAKVSARKLSLWDDDDDDDDDNDNDDNDDNDDINDDLSTSEQQQRHSRTTTTMTKTAAAPPPPPPSTASAVHGTKDPLSSLAINAATTEPAAASTAAASVPRIDTQTPPPQPPAQGPVGLSLSPTAKSPVSLSTVSAQSGTTKAKHVSLELGPNSPSTTFYTAAPTNHSSSSLDSLAGPDSSSSSSVSAAAASLTAAVAVADAADGAPGSPATGILGRISSFTFRRRSSVTSSWSPVKEPPTPATATAIAPTATAASSGASRLLGRFRTDTSSSLFSIASTRGTSTTAPGTTINTPGLTPSVTSEPSPVSSAPISRASSSSDVTNQPSPPQQQRAAALAASYFYDMDGAQSPDLQQHLPQPQQISKSLLNAAGRCKHDLVMAVQKRADVIGALLDKRRKLVSHLKADMKTYKSWRIAPLVAKARRQRHAYHVRVIRLRSRREEWALAVLQNRVDLISQLIAFGNSDRSMLESLLIIPRKLFASGQNSAIAHEFSVKIKDAELQAKKADEEFGMLLKRIDAKFSDEVRRASIVAIVESSPSEENLTYKFDENGALLDMFARVVADTRTIYGRNLEGCIRQLLADENPDQVDIQTPLHTIAGMIAKAYQVESEHAVVVFTVMLDKIIFPVMHFQLMDFADQADPGIAELDRRFEHYGRKLQDLHPRELQVDDAFLPLAMEQKALFSRCIATLSDLPLLSAPSDIVLCITTAIQEMGEDALQQLEARSREVLPNGALMQLEDVPSTPKLQSGTPSFEAVKSLPTIRDSDAAQRFVSLQQAAKALNADTMLPMAAFCILQSNCWNVHRLLWFVRTFGDENFKNGRYGYAVCTLEAAVLDIILRLGPTLTGEPSEVTLPADEQA